MFAQVELRINVIQGLNLKIKRKIVIRRLVVTFHPFCVSSFGKRYASMLKNMLYFCNEDILPQSKFQRRELRKVFFFVFLNRLVFRSGFGIIFNIYVYKPPRFALRLLEKLGRKISGTFAGKITDNFTEKLRRQRAGDIFKNKW